VPNRPKPPKVNPGLLKSWGLTDSNATTIPRVLKALGLLASNGDVTSYYEAFMQPSTGPAVLGTRVRELYSPLFQASHHPYKENHEELKRLFHIHSGGSAATINFQMQTFKALCEFSTFDGPPVAVATAALGIAPESPRLPGGASSNGDIRGALGIHIDLHIHLPENKAARDYEAIIQDIAKYIYRYEDVAND
jgi:hypothetical protein